MLYVICQALRIELECSLTEITIEEQVDITFVDVISGIKLNIIHIYNTSHIIIYP